jgi:GT2 family glycosyltransferase
MVNSHVSVIIVNWHSEAMLAAALSAMNKQTLVPERVLIVDNGSAARLPVEQYKLGPISVLRMAKNEGFAKANNRAIFGGVESDWVALLNPDAVPETTWLERLMDAARHNPDVSAFGSRQIMGTDHALMDGLGDVYHVSGAAWRDGHGETDGRHGTGPTEIFAACAAAALYKRDAFIEAGGFDEDFFCYFEDVDLGFRLRLLGYRTMLVPDALVYHIGGATSGGQQSDFAVYHGQRNLVWSYIKNMPWPYFWLYLPQHLLFNIASVLFLAVRGQGGVVLRAKWNALRGLPQMLRKRRAIQGDIRTSRRAIRAAMATGWIAPYRRRLQTMQNWLTPAPAKPRPVIGESLLGTERRKP